MGPQKQYQGDNFADRNTSAQNSAGKHRALPFDREAMVNRHCELFLGFGLLETNSDHLSCDDTFKLRDQSIKAFHGSIAGNCSRDNGGRRGKISEGGESLGKFFSKLERSKSPYLESG